MEFLILGPLEVRNGEDTVRLGAAKQRALLGVLLLHANKTVSTSRLVDELWGDQPPATAEKLVQGYVHALRKQLGDGLLQTQAPGYKLKVEPRTLDLMEFERLTEEARLASVPHSVELRRRALALWRGPPLADVVLEGSERHTLGRLSELRLTTQIGRIDAELQLGHHAQLVGELEALLAAHPHQERAAALLMLALYRSGRQSEALDVYRTVRGRLSNELGLQPGQELRDLETAILRQDNALSLPAHPTPAPVAEPATPPQPSPPPAPAATQRRRLVLGSALALLAAAALVFATLFFHDEPGSVVVPPNSVAAIDPATNRVIPESIVQTGIKPGPVAAGTGSIWVGNLEDRSLTRINPATNKVISTTPLPATPDAITYGYGALWAVSARVGTLLRVDPNSKRVDRIETRTLSNRTGAGVDVGDGSVWATYGDSTLAKVDPKTLDGGSTPAASGPSALVFASGFVWVANTGDDTVQRFEPTKYDFGAIEDITVCNAPSGIAAGEGAIWVACREDDQVWRIPADGGAPSRRIDVGHGPTTVAVGEGAIWVANTADRTVSRIDPDTFKVTPIELSNAPAGIAVSGGRVWVSVRELLGATS